MTAKYTKISVREMRDFFKSYQGWYEEIIGQELVFNYVIPSFDDLTIKVYTGIDVRNYNSREVGKDSIKVCAVNTVLKTGWIKTRRVHRVEGWKDNLRARIIQVISQAQARKHHYRQKR